MHELGAIPVLGAGLLARGRIRWDGRMQSIKRGAIPVYLVSSK